MPDKGDAAETNQHSATASRLQMRLYADEGLIEQNSRRNASWTARILFSQGIKRTPVALLTFAVNGHRHIGGLRCSPR